MTNAQCSVAQGIIYKKGYWICRRFFLSSSSSSSSRDNLARTQQERQHCEVMGTMMISNTPMPTVAAGLFIYEDIQEERSGRVSMTQEKNCDFPPVLLSFKVNYSGTFPTLMYGIYRVARRPALSLTSALYMHSASARMS